MTRLVLVLMLGLMAPVQPSAPAPLRGTWTASVGQTPSFQGTWTADIQANTPNAATGSWTLLNQANQIVAQGTWSAVKAARGWSGTWSARVLPPGGRVAGSGRIRSGSWRADVAPGGPSTFADLLRSTLERQLTGAWRSGGLQGRWTLRASS